MSIAGSARARVWRQWVLLAMFFTTGLLTACGGGGSGDAGPVAPSVTSQPQSASVPAGRSATFTVSASGTAPLTYQWQRDGAAIPSATSASYTLGNAQLRDSGAAFVAVVSNAAGQASSAKATLTVTPVAPTISTQPVDQAVPAAQSATFSVVAAGTPTPTYQWQRNGTNIPGATVAAYTLDNVQLTDSGALIAVVVSNSAGSATSSTATLTVNPVAPVIAVQPGSQTTPAGHPAIFSVTATGIPAPTYQWQRDGTNIPGAISSGLALSNVLLSDSGAIYTVVVSNDGGSVTSNAATLTVTPVAPTITAQPANQTVPAGQSASFAVAATGAPAPS